MNITLSQDGSLPTRFLVVKWNEDETLDALLTALEPAGWRKSNSFQIGNQVILEKLGSAAFNGWTKPEVKKWLPEVKRLLAPFPWTDGGKQYAEF